MFHVIFAPGSESSRERKFQGAKVPPMVLSLLGAKVRGNESSIIPVFQDCCIAPTEFSAPAHKSRPSFPRPSLPRPSFPSLSLHRPSLPGPVHQARPAQVATLSAQKQLIRKILYYTDSGNRSSCRPNVLRSVRSDCIQDSAVPDTPMPLAAAAAVW